MACSVWEQPSKFRRSKQSNCRNHSSIRKEGMFAGTDTEMSNLERFLEHITPSIQCQYPPKRTFADALCQRGKNQDNNLPFFMLGDLWRSFEEWSAYGVGIPLVLPSGETIVQYYVPYLSALQIYAQPPSTKRRIGDDSDWSDASDFSSDNENDRSSSSSGFSDRLSCTLSERGDCHGDLLFEYFERCSPHGGRAPLSGKINELAASFPRLSTLRSSGLSPSSWVSVAWYPIYRIPTGPTMSDLSTCFLTFHSLWTPPSLQDIKLELDASKNQHDIFVNYGDMSMSDSDQSCKQELEQWLEEHSAWRIKPGLIVDLPAFAMASYKLRGPFWALAGKADNERINLLASSADSWLRHMRAQHHPDFGFFKRMG